MQLIEYASMSGKSNLIFMIDVRTSLIVAVLLAGRVIVSAQGTTNLPTGSGVDTVRAACLGCHGPELILQQRLTRTGWEREIDKMVRWGAPVQTDADRALVLSYLTRLAVPESMSDGPDAAEQRGAEIFRDRCLSCHQTELVRQQRLTATGWAREVEKMMRWGAEVRDDEKQPLINYLSSGPDLP